MAGANGNSRATLPLVASSEEREVGARTGHSWASIKRLASPPLGLVTGLLQGFVLDAKIGDEDRQVRMSNCIRTRVWNTLRLVLPTIFIATFGTGCVTDVARADQDWYCSLRSNALGGDEASVWSLFNFLGGDGERNNFLPTEVSKIELAKILKFSVMKIDVKNRSYVGISLLHGWISTPNVVDKIRCVDKATFAIEVDACLVNEKWWSEADIDAPDKCPLTFSQGEPNRSGPLPVSPTLS